MSVASAINKPMWNISDEWICIDKYYISGTVDPKALQEMHKETPWNEIEGTLDFHNVQLNGYGGYTYIINFKNNTIKGWGEPGNPWKKTITLKKYLDNSEGSSSFHYKNENIIFTKNIKNTKNNTEIERALIIYQIEDQFWDLSVDFDNPEYHYNYDAGRLRARAWKCEPFNE